LSKYSRKKKRRKRENFKKVGSPSGRESYEKGGKREKEKKM